MSYFRLLHAVPNAPSVDVYANDNLVAKNLRYREFTEYRQIPAGSYIIKIYPTGNKVNPVLDTQLIIASDTINTIAATGLSPDISLFPILEPKEDIVRGKVCVRFIHLSPNAPAVDITLPDGTILFEDVMYEEITDYACINPGRFTIQARLTGTDQIVLTVPNIKLLTNRFYTFYAVGLVGETPPLQVLIPLDGNSYIQL